MRIIGIAAAGLRGQQFALETLGNNVANASTPGFKASKVDFAEAFQARLATTSTANGVPVGGALGVGSGVIVNAVGSNFQQGIIAPSDNPWDMAIDGDGFFQVELPNGDKAYTRAGAFQLDGEGKLVDGQGHKVVIEGGEEWTPESIGSVKNITVGPDGKITGISEDGSTVDFGQIQLAKFVQPEGLQKIGGSLFLPSVNSGEAQVANPGEENMGLIRSQGLEQSNVDIATTMTDLIQAQRAYEMNSKVVQAGDEMWSIANNLRRG